jgi:hypothetical protein
MLIGRLANKTNKNIEPANLLGTAVSFSLRRLTSISPLAVSVLKKVKKPTFDEKTFKTRF